MRSRLVWLITLPLSLAGCEIGHWLANALIGSPTGPDGELFEGAGPGAEFVPLLLVAGAAAALLALAWRMAGRWTSARNLSALPFAGLAPAVFILQEHLEHLLQSGGLPFDTVLEPTFLPGLALQLPFALAAYAIARALLQLADGVRGLIARRRARPALAASRPVVLRRRVDRPRVQHRASAHCGRAPPDGGVIAG